MFDSTKLPPIGNATVPWTVWDNNIFLWVTSISVPVKNRFATYGRTTQEAGVSYFYLPSGSVHKNSAWDWNDGDHWKKAVGGRNYGLCASMENPWTPRPTFVPHYLKPHP